MASYEKRGNLWTVRFRVPEDGKLSQKRLSGFKTKKEAELAYNKELILHEQKAAREITFAELFTLFLEYKKPRIKESSYVTFRQSITTYILPHFRAHKISEITKQSVMRWQLEIEKTPLKYKSKAKLHSIFVTLLNFAVEFYDLQVNPAARTSNFKNTEQKTELNIWTVEEFEQFIATIDDVVFKAFFATLYLTGMRRGEALALTWKEIDFDAGEINIFKTHTTKTVDGGYKITAPKTQSSVRKVFPGESLLAILRALKAYYSDFAGFGDSCFVFGMSRPLHTSTISRKKHEYCEKAGVKEIRVHDFRHSHASLLIHAGQNILLVAEQLGHADKNMTLNTYSHLFPNKRKEFANTLQVKI